VYGRGGEEVEREEAIAVTIGIFAWIHSDTVETDTHR
jgi:hypothetical protein